MEGLKDMQEPRVEKPRAPARPEEWQMIGDAFEIPGIGTVVKESFALHSANFIHVMKKKGMDLSKYLVRK
jgi:hypothetical protein